MDQVKGIIGLREYIAVVAIVIGMKISDDTPSILFKEMKNSAWISPIIMGILLFIPIYILLRIITLYHKQMNDFFDIITYLLGKYFGMIVIFMLWIISSIAIIDNTAIYSDIIQTMYFPKTPILLIYSLLIGVSVYGAKRGFEQIGSVARIFFPFTIIAFFISIVLTIIRGQTDFIFPILGNGSWETIKGSILKSSFFIDILFFCFLFPFIKDLKSFKKGTWISFILVICISSIGMLSYLMLFDMKTLGLLNYPHHEAIRFIFFGFVTNMEMFFVPFWLLSTFVRFTIYLYVNAMIFGRIFKVDHFEFIIPSLATVYMFIGLIPDSRTFVYYTFKIHFYNIMFPILLILPCLFYIIAKFKGDFANEQANSS